MTWTAKDCAMDPWGASERIAKLKADMPLYDQWLAVGMAELQEEFDAARKAMARFGPPPRRRSRAPVRCHDFVGWQSPDYFTRS